MLLQRYIDPLDRKLAVKKFAACLKSGKPKTFDKMIVMTSCDLSFEIGSASYDLTLRLQLYPHFDKYGKIAGIVLEGREVTLIKLESDAAAHIFSHQDYDGFCGAALYTKLFSVAHLHASCSIPCPLCTSISLSGLH